MSEALKVKLGPLTLTNPILVASGTFGYGLELKELVDLAKLGGICVKGISLGPRAGNPPPRICETPSGMLNAIGLANIGFDAFAKDVLPELEALRATVIVNLYGTSEGQFAELAERFDRLTGIAALEINVYCPNVKEGGIHFGIRPEPVAAITKAVRSATSLPVIVKLSPEAASLEEVASAAKEAGADILSLINTIRGMSIDVHTRLPRLGSTIGGLSGPAIRPIAVRMVYEVHRAVDIPLIGIGGIASLTDVLEFFLAGASAVQVGTANYRDPQTSSHLIDDLEKYCAQKGIAVQDLIGQVQTII